MFLIDFNDNMDEARVALMTLSAAVSDIDMLIYDDNCIDNKSSASTDCIYEAFNGKYQTEDTSHMSSNDLSIQKTCCESCDYNSNILIEVDVENESLLSQYYEEYKLMMEDMLDDDKLDEIWFQCLDTDSRVSDEHAAHEVNTQSSNDLNFLQRCINSAFEYLESVFDEEYVVGDSRTVQEVALSLLLDRFDASTSVKMSNHIEKLLKEFNYDIEEVTKCLINQLSSNTVPVLDDAEYPAFVDAIAINQLTGNSNIRDINVNQRIIAKNNKSVTVKSYRDAITIKASSKNDSATSNSVNKPCKSVIHLINKHSDEDNSLRPKIIVEKIQTPANINTSQTRRVLLQEAEYWLLTANNERTQMFHHYSKAASNHYRSASNLVFFLLLSLSTGRYFMT